MDKQTIRFRLTGIAPLLMHNGRLANPFDPFAQKMKEITSKRKKTEADQMALFRIEWEGGLYWSEETGPHIPGPNLESMVNDGARPTKQGQEVLRGSVVVEDKCPLLNTGWPKSKDLDAVYDMHKFVDIRNIVNPSTNGRSMRCRPLFREWAVEFTLAFDPEVLNEKDCKMFVITAGKQKGLCDGKPRFGRFAAEVVS
jgi:hypothetical protein